MEGGVGFAFSDSVPYERGVWVKIEDFLPVTECPHP